MEATQVIRELASTERMPVEAIEAARANRAGLVPAFVQLVVRCVAGMSTPDDDHALFWVFHLLGEWRERSAYRPLAALLRLPTPDIEDLLGDASADTCHRVMAAVFDGDPAPLQGIVRDPDCDEAIRSRMCEALAMLTLRGEIPREQTTQFLRECFAELEPQDECMVWEGWQSAIALLGLVELVPLVKQAFEREFITPEFIEFSDFEADLHRTLSGEARAAWYGEKEFELFGNTIEELSTWAFADAEPETWEGRERRERGRDERVLWTAADGPAVNPYKNVGRNDPCPCGSGKKFKKCCLGKVDAMRSERRAHEPRFEAEPDFADVFTDDEFAHEQTQYDPLTAPDPEDWLAMDEQERIDAVTDFHRRARIRLPRAQAHAMFHVIVENQIAEGDALPVRRTADRLMAEGLDRHDAIHAIGMVLAGHLNDVIRANKVEGDPNLRYFAELERLTAEQWRRSG
ncbi:MAG TPA: DUF1186 domain-containing protein [Xanthobacteraceae bacterium]|nr:DUF1186 domain-containing protein [Xanthobacteraceae bacterium]